MDYLWAGMIFVGILYGAFTGNMENVTDAVLDSAKESIQLCITMAGTTALWMGLMEIAKNASLIQTATDRIQPFISFLFPKLPKNHPARTHIATNFIANFLGLNWGATPAGLLAMEELSNLEKERTGKQSVTASEEMCTFLIINISSLQLLPVNILAYRSQYGSTNPAGIIAPAIIATFSSTVAAVIFCKLMHQKRDG
ncbi:MAG: nucleoside recognition protein [Lachnospiraceae bacterium]